MRALPFFALLLSLAACNSTKNPITPKGTSLFAWDPSKATHEGFSAATIGSKTTKDFTVTVRPQGSIPFTLDLHVVTAPVDFVETGKSVHHTAPVEITAAVGDNSGWELSGKCGEGPYYQMGPVDDAGLMITPEAMMQSCSIHHHRQEGTIFESDWQLAFTLNVFGDGKVEAFPADGIEIKAK